jgi:hypothetical protein
MRTGIARQALSKLQRIRASVCLSRGKQPASGVSELWRCLALMIIRECQVGG